MCIRDSLVDDRNLTGYAQVLEEVTAGAAQRVYTYGLNRISQSQASGTSFYGYDGQGSVRVLTDSSRAVTDRYDYDAFGTLIDSSGVTANAYLYAGEPRDEDLSLYYLRERWLAEQEGRFVSSDPLEHSVVISESINRYTYAFNRPTDLNDPSGLWPSAPWHNIHAQLLQSAFQSTLPAEDINVLVAVSNDQDNPIHGGQDTSRSFEHAMSAGHFAAGACEVQQGAIAAEALYNQFLHSNLEQAQLYEAIGTQATHETALRFLGKNLHAIADSTSPSHQGFQPWCGLGHLGLFYEHEQKEWFISAGDFVETVDKLRHYYMEAIHQQITLRTLILTASVRSLQEQIAWNELLPVQVSLALSLAALGLPIGAGF